MIRSASLIVLAIGLFLGGPIGVIRAQDTATPTASDAGGWPVFRANPEHTGTAAGPGPTGTPGVRWRFENGGGTQSPVVADGVVYIVGAANYLFALDAITGEERWRFAANHWTGAPAVGDGVVVVGTIDGLYALDTATGDERWQYPTEGAEEASDFSWASPTIADGVVYVAEQNTGTLLSFDVGTGTERWRFETNVRVAVTPAVADGVVYVATEPLFSGAGVPAVLYAVDAATGGERWKTEIAGHTFLSSPAVVDGVIYFGDSTEVGNHTLHAVDAATGQPKWRFEVTQFESIFSSPAVADGMVFFGSDALFAVDAATGQQRWRLGMGVIWSSPAVADGVVYVGGDEGFLVAADAMTGRELWNVPIGNGGGFSPSSPAIADGMVYINGRDGYFYAIGDTSDTTTATPEAETRTPFADVAAETSVDVTWAVDQLPPNPAFVYIAATTWPAGSSYQNREDFPGIAVHCVVSGQWAYRLVEPGAEGAATPEATTSASETVLGAGDCTTLPFNVPRDERNPGSEPAEVLTLAAVPEYYPVVPAERAPEIAFTGELVFDQATWGPASATSVAVSLRRAELAPNAVVDAYAGDGLGAIVAIVDPTTHVSRRGDGSVRNLGDAPVTAYLVSVQSSDAAGTAGTSETESTAAETSEATPVATDAPAAFLWQTTGGSEPFAGPSDVEIDPEGNIWVVDGAHHQFQIFGPDGAFLESWGTEGTGEGEFDFVRVNGDPLAAVAFDAQGNIYVADAGNRRIQKFDRDRNFLLAWGGFGAGDGRFVDPIYVTLDGDGNVYVTDDRRDDIQKFDGDGNYLATFAGHGREPGQIVFTGGVAVDAQGNIYVADFGNNRIQKLGPDGTFLAEWGEEGTGPGQFIGLNSLALDAMGNVYAADGDNHRIQVFDSDGQFLAAWGGDGEGEGQFAVPIALALDGAGYVYVADIVLNRVQAFRLLPPLSAAPEATPAA